MTILGHTRSRVNSHYALIAPDTHVWAPLPGWGQSRAAVHISPALGSRFMQATVEWETGGELNAKHASVERFLYPLSGVIDVELRKAPRSLSLEPGQYAFLPAGTDYRLCCREPARLAVFEKTYQSAAGVHPPDPYFGVVADVPGEPFQGDPDARLQTLLPTDERFDLAVNVFTYQPGARLPQVEIHVMEHGLLMLEGEGIYRLRDDWFPVAAGDVIWMASYCPQWFVAMGKSPARYVYYKDVNRSPMAAGGGQG